MLRSKPNGGRAVVIDHVGNVARHGLPDAHRDWSLDAPPRGLRKAAEAAPAIRTCMACYRVFSASTARSGAPCAGEVACIRLPPALVVGRRADPRVVMAILFA